MYALARHPETVHVFARRPRRANQHPSRPLSTTHPIPHPSQPRPTSVGRNRSCCSETSPAAMPRQSQQTHFRRPDRGPARGPPGSGGARAPHHRGHRLPRGPAPTAPSTSSHSSCCTPRTKADGTPGTSPCAPGRRAPWTTSAGSGPTPPKRSAAPRRWTPGTTPARCSPRCGTAERPRRGAGLHIRPALWLVAAACTE